MMYVLYHDSCMDGYCSAYLAWTKLLSGPHYIPVQYQQPLPEIQDNSIVYILDFSYPADVLLALAERSKRVIVLDHHKTAKAALDGLGSSNLEIRFDMNKSGAMLTWDYFYGGHAPKLVSYVQDRDLWTWKLPASREINAALGVEDRLFEDWVRVQRLMEDDNGFNEFTSRGSAILAAQDQHVESLCKKAFFVKIGHSLVPAINSSLFQSEIGERLCEIHPEADFAAIWFDKDLDTQTWSLRSRRGFDVSAVAKMYGGGGHAAAAGFTVPRGVITS